VSYEGKAVCFNCCRFYSPIPHLPLDANEVRLALAGSHENRESLKAGRPVVLSNRVRDVIKVLELNVSAPLMTGGTLVPEEVHGDYSTGLLLEELSQIVLLHLMGGGKT